MVIATITSVGVILAFIAIVLALGALLGFILSVWSE